MFLRAGHPTLAAVAVEVEALEPKAVVAARIQIPQYPLYPLGEAIGDRAKLNRTRWAAQAVQRIEILVALVLMASLSSEDWTQLQVLALPVIALLLPVPTLSPVNRFHLLNQGAHSAQRPPIGDRNSFIKKTNGAGISNVRQVRRANRLDVSMMMWYLSLEQKSRRTNSPALSTAHLRMTTNGNCECCAR